MQSETSPGADVTDHPTCMVVDDDPALVRTLQVILRNRRIGPLAFARVDDVVEACRRNAPDIIFLDLPMSGFDAVDVIQALGRHGYGGAVVLVSGLNALLHQVTRVGERNGLVMLPPLAKPFRAHQVEQLLRDFAPRRPPAPAAVA
jgi:DNA-binding NtrC family response regulator